MSNIFAALFMFTLSVLTFLFPILLWADSIVGGTEVLPKGRRAFFYQYRNIQVGGQYLQSGEFHDLKIHDTLTVSEAIRFNADAQNFYNKLSAKDHKELDPLSMAEIEFDPDVRTNAHILGFAYGLTDRLMLGFGVPIINAEVQVKSKVYTERRNIEKLKEKYKNKSTDKNISESDRIKYLAIIAVLEKIPDITGNNIQYFLVHSMGYAPLGNWSAEAPGDFRSFLHYNFFEVPNRYRQGGRWGMIFPTGRKDDPDLLNDFAFGNEALSTYIESRHDLYMVPERLTLSGVLYIEKSFPSKKEVRVPGDMSFVSSEKENVSYQRGSVFSAHAGFGYHISTPTEIYYQQTYSQKEKDVYSGSLAESVYTPLAKESDSEEHAHSFGISYSTVPRYKKSADIPPVKIGLFYTELLGARSAKDVQYTALELQVYF